MMRETARLAAEQVAIPVGCRDVAAARAAFASIARIDLDHRHPPLFRLVLEEEHQLAVGPSVDLGTLRLSQAAVTDTVELFDGNDRASGFVGEVNDIAAYLVIDGLHEALLPAGQPFQRSAHRMRRSLCLPPLERRAHTQIAVTHMLRVPATAPVMPLAIRRSGQHIDAPIDTDDGIVRSGLFANLLLERERQKDLATVDREAAVAEGPISKLVLQIGWAGERNRLASPGDGPQRQAGRAQRDIATTLAALQDNRLLPELTRSRRHDTVRAQRCVFRCDVPDTGLGDLCRQPTLPSRPIRQSMKAHRIGEAASIERNAANGVAGFRPDNNRLPRYVERQGDLEFDGANDLRHAPNISCRVGIFNTRWIRPSGQPAFRCQLKQAVPGRRS